MRRLTVLLILTAIAVFANLQPGSAQQPSAVQESDVRDLVQVMYPNATYNSQLQLLATPVAEIGRNTLQSGLKRPPTQAELERLNALIGRTMQKLMPKSNWDQEWAAMLKDRFSPGELRELAAFYRSPVGKKIQTATPEMHGRMFEIATQRMDQAITAVVGSVQSELKKEFAGLSALPAPVRVGGAVKPPVKTRDVRPVYPKSAQDAGIQGLVIIEAVIDSEGKVSGATILRSIPALDQAAIDAVRQWEFSPTTVDGTPTPVIMTVTVTFSLK